MRIYTCIYILYIYIYMYVYVYMCMLTFIITLAFMCFQIFKVKTFVVYLYLYFILHIDMCACMYRSLDMWILTSIYGASDETIYIYVHIYVCNSSNSLHLLFLILFIYNTIALLFTIPFSSYLLLSTICFCYSIQRLT